MIISLREIADLIGGRLTGDPDLQITGAATIRDARPGEITLADKPKLAPQLAACGASAAVVSEGLRPATLAYVTVDDVHRSFAKVVAFFRPPRLQRNLGVSPQAVVSPTARIGDNVNIHAGATIGDDVEIGDGCTLHAGVHVLAGCKLGADCVLFPNVVLYENTIVGPRCVLHAGVVLGAYGFGYETANGQHVRSAQLGYVEIGTDVEIGAGSTIDRGTYGPTIIGEGTKIDNQVMIAHNCRIGRHNILCSQVGIAGSSTTGDYVVLAGQVGIKDHIQIGDHAVVGAQAGVMCDIPAGIHYFGTPAMPERDALHVAAAQARLPEMRKQLRALQRQVDGLTRPESSPRPHEAA